MTIPTPSDPSGAPASGAVVAGVESHGAFPLAGEKVPPSADDALPLAGLSARWFAYLIDNLIVATVTVAALAVAHTLGAPAPSLDGAGFDLLYATWLFANLLFIGYATFLHGVCGQTIGKWLMGIALVRTGGASLGMGRSLLRTFGYYISGFLWLGFLIAFLGERRQALHDLMADTLVVEIA